MSDVERRAAEIADELLAGNFLRQNIGRHLARLEARLDALSIARGDHRKEPKP